MAVDKLVDSTQLDADLTSVANAIRTKGGTSASLAFPSGFVSAIANIPSGGGVDDFEDFTAGNIQAIVSHGTEWIQLDYESTLNDLVAIKLADTSVTSWEAYWSVAVGNTSNGLQRSGSGNNFAFVIRNGSCSVSIIGFGTSTPVVAVHSTIGFTPASGTPHPLVLGRNWYRGNFESTIATYSFYGLNVLDEEMRYVKRYMPWLDNGEACVKEIISGTIYRNSGTGAYDYIDSEGVLHSA